MAVGDSPIHRSLEGKIVGSIGILEAETDGDITGSVVPAS